jgi:hypothetical protein
MTDWLEPFRRDTERLRQENIKFAEETDRIREESERIREANKKLHRIEEDERIKRLIREVIRELDYFK